MMCKMIWSPDSQSLRGWQYSERQKSGLRVRLPGQSCMVCTFHSFYSTFSFRSSQHRNLEYSPPNHSVPEITWLFKVFFQAAAKKSDCIKIILPHPLLPSLKWQAPSSYSLLGQRNTHTLYSLKKQNSWLKVKTYGYKQEAWVFQTGLR